MINIKHNINNWIRLQSDLFKMTSKAFFLNIKKMWLINFALINFISQQKTVHRENPPNKNMISEKINDIYL